MWLLLFIICRWTERNPSPSSSGYSSLGDRRWRRDVGLWRSASEVSGDKPMRHVDIDLEAHVEGNLSSQTSLIILDTLETIIQVVSQHDNLQVLYTQLFFFFMEIKD